MSALRREFDQELSILNDCNSLNGDCQDRSNYKLKPRLPKLRPSRNTLSDSVKIKLRRRNRAVRANKV
jgi:hypothetical protein